MSRASYERDNPGIYPVDEISAGDLSFVKLSRLFEVFFFFFFHFHLFEGV